MADPDALTVVQAFQDTEGWSDNTIVLLLTDFINAEKLSVALNAYLKTRQGDQTLSDELPELDDAARAYEANKRPAERIAFLERAVDDLELSVRTVNCLRNADCYGAPTITTVADLVKFSANDLLRLPNLGKRTLRDIRELLDDYGLKLSTTDITRLP